MLVCVFDVHECLCVCERERERERERVIHCNRLSIKKSETSLTSESRFLSLTCITKRYIYKRQSGFHLEKWAGGGAK